MNSHKLALLFKSNIYTQYKINKLIKVSTISNPTKELNYNTFNKLLDFNLIGLKKYNDLLNLYISNNTNLISNIKNDQFSNLDYGFLSADKKNILNKSNENLYNDTPLVNKVELNKVIDAQLISQYIKSITKINFLSKGTMFTYSQQINYNFNRVNDILFNKIYCLLFNSFISMNSLISKPVFEITSEKVIIHLFFYLFKQNNNKQTYKSNTFINLNRNKLNLLCIILNNLFNKPVTLELNRLYYPYFDSNIFVNFLANIINNIQIRYIFNKFFNKAIIKNPFKLNSKLIVKKFPSLLSGINIKIAGRLLTHKIVPRKTITTVRRGALARVKINYLDTARYTNKNKRGAFSITITTGQFLNKY
jgi:Mitochondrial ribosomal protein (VAR1)